MATGEKSWAERPGVVEAFQNQPHDLAGELGDGRHDGRMAVCELALGTDDHEMSSVGCQVPVMEG